MDCTKEEFLHEFGIREEEFVQADISWEELLEIEADYEKRMPGLEQVRKNFMDEFIIDKNCGFHSFSSRLKQPKHLLAKIIRKRVENYAKYKDMTIENYQYFATDLIGVRGLLLYREDWVNFHQYITEAFSMNKERYAHDDVSNLAALPDYSMAEAPKVHIRKGDYAEIYYNWISPDNIKDGKHYRSIHYILKYQNEFIEVQVRTLFEEGWGEVDHHILYPYKTSNSMLREYSELLNRLAGMADEMSSFYRRIKDLDTERFAPKEDMVQKALDEFEDSEHVSDEELLELEAARAGAAIAKAAGAAMVGGAETADAAIARAAGITADTATAGAAETAAGPRIEKSARQTARERAASLIQAIINE